MAHTPSSRRADRRTLLAAGTAALLTAPLLAAPAGGALALVSDLVPDELACTPQEVADDEALREACEEAGLLSEVTGLVPEPLQRAVDPVERVVDDVLKNLPEPVDEVVEQVPGVPDAVPDAVSDAVPGDPVEVLPVEPPPSEQEPAGEVVSIRPSSGPPQGPGIPPPPFAARTVAVADTTTTPPPRSSFTAAPRPFVGALPTDGRLFGDLPARAEEFLSRTPTPAGALSRAATTTTSGPDASSWLFATAAGMILLLGAGHVAAARQRYGASVAR